MFITLIFFFLFDKMNACDLDKRTRQFTFYHLYWNELFFLENISQKSEQTVFVNEGKRPFQC